MKTKNKQKLIQSLADAIFQGWTGRHINPEITFNGIEFSATSELTKNDNEIAVLDGRGGNLEHSLLTRPDADGDPQWFDPNEIDLTPEEEAVLNTEASGWAQTCIDSVLADYERLKEEADAETEDGRLSLFQPTGRQQKN